MQLRRTSLRITAARPRWGASTHLLRCAVSVLLLLLLSSAVLSPTHAAAAAAAADAAPVTDFRCLRPFAAMDTFPSVAKATPAQNCDYFYFHVLGARAKVQCAAPHSASSPDDVTCNVTVRWSMRRAPDVVARLRRQVGTDKDYFTVEQQQQQQQTRTTQRSSATGFITEDEDVWRYSLALRAKGDSTIHYKGFNNGDGYSLCCDALVEADCAWVAPQHGDNDLDCDEETVVGRRTLDGSPSPLPVQQQQQQHSRLLRRCPLPFPDPSADLGGDRGGGGGEDGARVALTDLDDDEDDEDDEDKDGGVGVFHGVVVKPLHRLVDGPWEAVVELWRRRQRVSVAGADPRDRSVEAEVLGRLVVPFTLDLASVRQHGRLPPVPSTALSVGGVGDSVEVSADDADL
ncbi:hypothetical protein NESM_000414900 [Novymonas esmeraldas]|uniref:Uncharacterized protein n=1 Tax=Novymonas esmeraldas TaxID=1808958 RepID=A0AAW0EMN8_9TRYP